MHDTLDQGILDRCIDNQSRVGGAVLAHVPEHRLDNMLGNDVEVLRIIQDNAWVFAAAFEHDTFEVGLRRIFQEFASDLGRAGKRDHVDIRVYADGLAGDRTFAGDDIQDATRQACFVGKLRDAKRGHGGFLRRFDNQRVSTGERRSDFPGHHQHREVPGQHTADHADRLAHDHGDRIVTYRSNLVVGLVGGFGMPFEAMQRFRDVDRLDLLDRLAALDAFKYRKFVVMPTDQLA